MEYSLPGSSVHGIFQARILEWIAMSSSRGSSRPRNGTQVSHIAGRCFTIWATWEASTLHSNWKGLGEPWSFLPTPLLLYSHGISQKSRRQSPVVFVIHFFPFWVVGSVLFPALALVMVSWVFPPRASLPVSNSPHPAPPCLLCCTSAASMAHREPMFSSCPLMAFHGLASASLPLLHTSSPCLTRVAITSCSEFMFQVLASKASLCRSPSQRFHLLSLPSDSYTFFQDSTQGHLLDQSPWSVVLFLTSGF